MLTRDHRRALETEPDTDELIDQDLEAILNEAEALEADSLGKIKTDHELESRDLHDLQKQDEDHRAQLLHIETLTMMAKYQIVFIKMEGFLRKLTLLFKKKRKNGLHEGFYRLLKVQISARQRTRIYPQLLESKLRYATDALESRLASSRLMFGLENIKNRANISKNFEDLNEKEYKLRNALARAQKKKLDLEDNIKKRKTKRKSGSKHKLEMEKVSPDLIKNARKSKLDSSEMDLGENYLKLKSKNQFLKTKISNLQQSMMTFLTDIDSTIDTLASKKK
jgi:hypothetical protein